MLAAEQPHGRARPESQNGYPSGRSFTRLLLIRWGHGGEGEGYTEPVSTLDDDRELS